MLSFKSMRSSSSCRNRHNQQPLSQQLTEVKQQQCQQAARQSKALMSINILSYSSGVAYFLIINEDAPYNASRYPRAYFAAWLAARSLKDSAVSSYISAQEWKETIVLPLISYELSEVCFSCVIKLPVVCNLHLSWLYAR